MIQLFSYNPVLRCGFMINFWDLKHDDEHNF